MKSQKNQLSGFTLIELIIYTAIVGTMLTIIIGFLWSMVFGNIKEVSYQEAQQNARFVMSKIIQEAKKASGVNAPAIGESSGNLSLIMAIPETNPTIFDIDNGRLRLRRGGLPASYLNSENTLINNLLFTNLSHQGQPPTIRIEMTLGHLNPDNRQEYQASVDLASTVVLLPGGASALSSRLGQLRYRWRNDDGGE